MSLKSQWILGTKITLMEELTIGIIGDQVQCLFFFRLPYFEIL